MVSTVSNEHTWFPTEEMYCYVDPVSGNGYSLKTYRRTHAKSKFSSEHNWRDHNRDKITNELVRPDSFMESDKLYKLGSDGLWHCIFEPDSDAGWEFVRGNISVRELRDSIPWLKTF